MTYVRITSTFALAAALYAGSARAQTVATPATATPAAPSEKNDPFSSAALSDETLGTVAGREDAAKLIANANQQNTVANNSVTGNSVTGNVAIDGNAFQNLQGFALISANSGNNVAINSAMNVTINLAH
jgi:phosphodiesterase/alkaline phosphatase D-like protein